MTKFFQAGWRPAYGWLGIVVVVLHLVILPASIVVASIFGITIVSPTDVPAMTALLTSVIAIAGMRSYDKQKGTDTREM